jgi:hypothetical protein
MAAVNTGYSLALTIHVQANQLSAFSPRPAVAPGSLNCLEGTIRFSSLSYWGGSRGFQSLVCCLNQQDETRDPHQTPNRHQHLQHVSKVHLSRRARPIASVMALGNGTKGPLLMWRL